MADVAQASALKDVALHLELGLARLNEGVAEMKIARRVLSDAYPQAKPGDPLGVALSDIAAFSRKMAEAVAYLNGMRGGTSTANRIRKVIDSLEG